MQVPVQIKEVSKAICTSFRRCQVIRKQHIYSHQCRADVTIQKTASLLFERRLHLKRSTALSLTWVRSYKQSSETNNNGLLTYQCPFCSYTFEGIGFKPWLLTEHLQHCRKARIHQRRENLQIIIKEILDKKLNIHNEINNDVSLINRLDKSGDFVKDCVEDDGGKIHRSNHLKDVNEVYYSDLKKIQDSLENNTDFSHLIDKKSYFKHYQKYPHELRNIFDSVVKNELYKNIQIQDIFSKKDLIEPYIKYDKTGKKKSYICLQCGYESNRESVIKQHLLIHTGEKQFRCPKCGKGFASAAEVTRHLITHKKEKAFECPYCDKKFNKQVNLTSHIKSLHLGEKPYACSECGKNFSTTQQLDNHKLIHSGEKPYACPYCEYRSTQKSNLNRHLRKHTKEKPHQCPYCDFRTTRSDNLSAHIDKFHEDAER